MAITARTARERQHSPDLVAKIRHCAACGVIRWLINGVSMR
jgi:hypothetical protein